MIPLKLAQLVGENGRVLAFDVQKEALQQTEKRLQLAGISERVCLRTC
jgi:tRNA A58 N-methylase Trm61